ncbi:asparagine synthase (glutamine-hydrolyzing) [Methanococcus vannielii SB]|uniref:Putative asparagine synthetase [glutamine-hydrolyzing] n=1 Tax=Methanococcus vannielii (strain ATCC 35089 / DSM 1224 / JCM 13029 / OCM 148 / SB) TaxID=406327 RepID=A6UNP9_METVS|nr:asparagine synthase (glutamine-hydrolyzing) [Methanococcus vannielii]ABR54121.1 asparagine synthase (glutamine-hydrolyzing) [Methanococcus vannielii SB]
MCSISGIIAKDGESTNGRVLINNLSKHCINMMKMLKHRGPDSSGIILDGNVYYFNSFENTDLDFDGTFRLGISHNRLAIVGTTIQPISNHDKSIWIVCNGEIYNHVKLRENLATEHEFKTDSDSEVIIHSYEDELVDILDGDYAYALYNKEKNLLELRRDLMGVKPLFYLNRKDYFAFSSEKKALFYCLMEIEGMDFYSAFNFNEIHRVNPNSRIIYELNENSYYIEDNLEKINSNYFEGVNYEKCKDELENALLESVLKRVNGIEKVGIIYSGGVDSTLISKIASEFSNVTLYSVGTKDSEDLIYAERAAIEMGLKFRKKIILKEDYEKYLLSVAQAIDELDVMKLSVGIPIYVASQMAKEDGITVVLSGQGADELFAGYHRYKRIYDENGEEYLKESIKKDVYNIYRANLERDDHVTMANGVELRVPFLDKKVVEVSLSIPVKYKIEGQGKKILREIALKYIPEYIAERPKKAAQYGSGSEKMVYSVSKDYGYSKKEISKFFENVLIEKIRF